MNEPAAGLEDAASGLWSSIERRWNAGMDVIDRVQRRRKPTAFVVGVLKRFAEDRGVQLGALIAYYGLLSIFPLMVVLLTVAGFVFDSRPDLRADLERTVLQQFPTMGPTIRQNTQAIRGNFVSLVLGLAGVVEFVLVFGFWLILISAIFSFFPQNAYHPLAQLTKQLSEPLLRPIRRFLPPVGGFDLSPMLAMLLLVLARILLAAPLHDLGGHLARG